MTTIGRIWATLGIDATTFEAGMEKASRSLQRAGRKMERIGHDLTMKVSLPLVGIGVAALKMSMDFNKSMANVATLIPGNVKRVEELKKSVQDMAIATGKSTQDLSEGLYQVISAFGDTADTAKILEINAKAAAAGLATTKDAIDLTSAVTKAYGDTSARAVQQVSDLAFVTVKLGQTTFPELAQSIGKVTPLAKELGVSMQELFAAFATFTGVTGKAPEVETQFRGALKAFMAPTKDMQNLMKRFGAETGKQFIAKMGGVGNAIKLVAGEAEKSKVPLQKFMGEVEAQTIALVWAGTQADAYAQKLGAMGQAAGATNEAFGEVTGGINKVGFSLEQLKQKLAVTMQKLGDALGPALLSALNAIDPLVNSIGVLATAFAAADPVIQKTVVAIAAAFAIGGPLMIAIGKFISFVTAAFSPAGVIALAVLALGGVIWGLVSLFQDTWRALKQSGEVFRTVWTALCTGLGEIWRKLWDGIANFLAGKLQWIQDKIKAAAEFIKGSFNDLATELVWGSIIPKMVDDIASEFERLHDHTTATTDRTTREVTRTWESAASTITQTLGDMFAKGKVDMERFAEEMLRIAVDGLLMPLQQMLKQVFGGIGSSFFSLFGFEKGGVFHHGRPLAFAHGGVVRRPTLFPMAHGNVGLMGEAGAEAILPLTRIGGDLGVKAQIAPGDINIQIINNTGVAVEPTVKKGQGGTDWIIQLDKAMAQAWRQGGEFRRTMEQTSTVGIRPIGR